MLFPIFLAKQLGEAKGSGTHHYVVLGAEEGMHTACWCADLNHGGLGHPLHLLASFWEFALGDFLRAGEQGSPYFQELEQHL